jgi:hypothetical protein
MAGYVVDHPVFDHTDYKRLENWDLGGYVQDVDIDGDAKDDFVHSTGCAYLSKADTTQIPEDRKCKVDKDAYLPPGLPEVGQKFLDLPTASANWEELNNYMHAFGNAYAFKYDNKWYLVEKRGIFEPTHVLTIQENGLLAPTDVPFKHRVHQWLYVSTNILIIPVFFLYIPMGYVTSLIYS